MRPTVLAALAVSAAIATSALGAASVGQVREVSMPGKVFVPGRAYVLVGDTVVWRNGDAATHTVTANDDSFDSGYLAPGGTFARSFTKAGLYAYHCTIHKFMRGTVRVVPVALSAPVEPVISGGHVVLQGLAPAGTAQVTLAQVGGAELERRIVPAVDGSFSVSVRVFVPVGFRAVVGDAVSPLLRIAVAPRVRVQLGAGSLVGTATPSRAGARAALQRYDRERFAWVTLARTRVDARSHVALPLPADRAGHFRVVVHGDDGWADGFSQAFVGR